MIFPYDDDTQFRDYVLTLESPSFSSSCFENRTRLKVWNNTIIYEINTYNAKAYFLSNLRERNNGRLGFFHAVRYIARGFRNSYYRVFFRPSPTSIVHKVLLFKGYGDAYPDFLETSSLRSACDAAIIHTGGLRYPDDVSTNSS